MDERFRGNKHSIKVSIESRNSNLSSCRSLQRPSWNEGSKSLSKRHSFIEVMSLESGRKSDIYEKMLEEERPLQRQSLGAFGEAISHNHNHNPYDYPYVHEDLQFELPTGLDHRRSEENHFSISHTCKCYKDCEWETCSCLEAKNELCLQNYCCQECITRKNLLLQSLTVKIEEQDKVFCTCKKTKCNKKYCSCFAAGIMCGDKCSCEGCINCPRKSEHGMDVEEEDDPLTIQQLAEMKMPEKMEFDPPLFNHHYG